MDGAPVLIYHALERSFGGAGARGPGEQLYVLQVEQFRQQMQYLHRSGFRVLLLQEMLRCRSLPEKSVVLTFDDGHESNLTLALPILLELGFRADFFITTGWTGSEGYLAAGQIRELLSAGMGVGSHGVTHSLLDECGAEQAVTELVQSKRFLEGITGSEVAAFSAPGGRLPRSALRSAAAHGYGAVCTSEIGLFRGGRSATPATVPRIAVTNRWSLDDFVALWSWSRLSWLRLRQRSINGARAILGRSLYQKMRSRLLS